METIEYNANEKKLFDRLEEIIKKYDIKIIVIGIPISLDGTKNIRVETTKKFIHKLKSKFNKIKFYEIDERLTTVQAHKTMNFLDVKKDKKKSLVDTISASLILENFVNSYKK